MKKRIMATVMAAGLLLPGATLAGSNIAGAGFATCREYSEGLADPATYDLVVSWILGFYSGMNANNDAEGKPQRDLSGLGGEENSNALTAEIAKACEADPDAPLVTHVYPLYETLPEYVKE